jgi:hypothetical protein
VNQAEYRRLRRQLDEELRAGIEMLRTGHRAKVEALEALWIEPAVEVPAAEPATRETSVPAARQPPEGRRTPGEIRAEVVAALAKLGEVFEKSDLCRAMGYEPHRSSLHRVIEDMLRDGELETESSGAGRRATRYRKGRQAAQD